MEHRELLEKAVKANADGLALFEAIQKGEEPREKYEQAEALIAEAGALTDQAQTLKAALEQRMFLTEGIGSLTAAPPKGNGDPPKSEWKSLGEFFLAVRNAGIPNAGFDPRLTALQVKTLEEGTGASGGYLVPTEFRAEVLAKVAELSIVRPRATIIPMTSRSVQIPTLDQTGTPGTKADSQSAFFGGLFFEWVEEAGDKPDVEITFKMVELVVHELAGWMPVSNNLIEDSAISLDAFIRGIFPRAMAHCEDWHFFNGTGVGQPQGVIHAPATVQPGRFAAGHIDWSDIKAMLHAFQPGANGVWVAHICTMEELMAMQDVAGHNMWVPNMRDGIPERLMGYPLIFSEKVPNLGSKGDIGLYDFSYYLIGDRTGPRIDSSTHERFRKNQTTYRISERVDGQPWLSEPVELLPGGVFISPFVALSDEEREKEE